jgi:N4-gp56 family major capsid protein
MFGNTQVKTFYEMELLLRALPKLYHTSFMKEATIPQGGGNTVEWRKLSALPAATTPLAEAVTPAPEAMEWKTITATPLQYGAFLLHSDILQFVAIDPLQDQISRALGEQAGLTADTLGRELMVASGTVQIVGQTTREAITATDILKEAEIGAAWATTTTLYRSIASTDGMPA